MKDGKDRPLSVATAMFLVFGTSFLAWAQVTGADERTLPYRGHIELDGEAVTGNVQLSFTLYDAAVDGTPLWGPESHPAVSLSGGAFSVALGTIEPISLQVLQTTTLYASDRSTARPWRAPKGFVEHRRDALAAGIEFDFLSLENRGLFRFAASARSGEPGVIEVRAVDPWVALMVSPLEVVYDDASGQMVSYRGPVPPLREDGASFEGAVRYWADVPFR